MSIAALSGGYKIKGLDFHRFVQKAKVRRFLVGLVIIIPITLF